LDTNPTGAATARDAGSAPWRAPTRALVAATALYLLGGLVVLLAWIAILALHTVDPVAAPDRIGALIQVQSVAVLCTGLVAIACLGIAIWWVRAVGAGARRLGVAPVTLYHWTLGVGAALLGVGIFLGCLYRPGAIRPARTDGPIPSQQSIQELATRYYHDLAGAEILFTAARLVAVVLLLLGVRTVVGRLRAARQARAGAR
jgi:hypothetical protein